MPINNTHSQKSILGIVSKYSDSIPQIEAETILCSVFKCTRTELYIKDIYVDERIEGICDSFIQRRLLGEPIQYIIGFAEFMGINFMVNKDVFIPRPETELIIQEALSSASSFQPPAIRDLNILDLCTGCGNIAITLARLIPQAKLTATDISLPALKIAHKNAVIHGVSKNVLFSQGDLFHGLTFDKKYKFDIIVCNPPYIKSADLESLQREVRFEPGIALNGGIDGLDFYRRIAGAIPEYLKAKGSLFLEVGLDQVEDVKNIFGSGNDFGIHKVVKDYAGIERVIIWTNLL